MKYMMIFIVLLSACTSMPTKQRRAREAAEIGLVSHPEFAELRDTLARLERVLENVNMQLASLQEGRLRDREGERDDMEKVLELVGVQVAELKAEIAKGRR